MIKHPGRQPSRSEQLLLQPLVKALFPRAEIVVIHHITEDSPRKLQLEVEYRYMECKLGETGKNVCKFERIFI